MVAGIAEIKLPQAATVSSGTVAEWVREGIRAGRFVPGQRLIEADIVRATGASRSRVREALQRLEVERLLVIEEFRGASVREFTADEMRQLYHARMALEGLAVRDFTLVDDAPRKAELAALQEQLNACENTADHRRFSNLNDAWHDVIIAGARNDYIATFVRRLRVPSYRLLFSSFYAPERINQANADHRAITAAILAGDADGAERRMRSHIADALAAITELEAQLTR